METLRAVSRALNLLGEGAFELGVVFFEQLELRNGFYFIFFGELIRILFVFFIYGQFNNMACYFYIVSHGFSAPSYWLIRNSKACCYLVEGIPSAIIYPIFNWWIKIIDSHHNHSIFLYQHLNSAYIKSSNSLADSE